MKSEELDSRMRRLECFHALRLPDGARVILRLDGRGFSGFTETRCEKPFDPVFHDWMVKTSGSLLATFQATYAYTESDEISVLLPGDWDHFDRELEKTLSLSAGLASATFSLACGSVAQFDCRAIVAARDDQVIDYFRWRQADASRCALNGWCYWTLRKNGQSVAGATRALEGKSAAEKNELLFQAGINFNDLPLWQRRGTGLYREVYQREGYNPRTQEKVIATRRRVCVDEGLPKGEDYAALLDRLLRTEGSTPAAGV